MPKPSVVDSVRFQRGACLNLSSPFYAELLGCALDDAAEGIPFWDALDNWDGNPRSSLLTLRILGALHDLVLSGREASLAAAYPSEDFAGDPVTAWAELNSTIARNEAFIESRLDAQVQTNEVRRCAALMPGFLVVSKRAGLPLRLAELGASAGLNLCWDMYRYQIGDVSWGNESAPLTLATTWHGDPPPMVPVEVRSRRGCDISPLDMSSEDDRRRLQSFVWPDQRERLTLLRRAIGAASKQQLDLVQMSAGDFVDEVLSDPPQGEVTVIYHSIMWLYVPENEQIRIAEAIERAGQRATHDSPVAWLRMEFVDGNSAALWLDYWPNPDGENTPHVRERLADCHYHGTSVTWFGPAATS
jgi:hypothetical protein